MSAQYHVPYLLLCHAMCRISRHLADRVAGLGPLLLLPWKQFAHALTERPRVSCVAPVYMRQSPMIGSSEEELEEQFWLCLQNVDAVSGTLGR